VSERQVAPEKVLVLLQQWLRLIADDLIITVDDNEVSPGDRKRVLAMDLEERRPAPALAAIPAPDVIEAYAGTIHRAFEQVREAEWEATKRVQALTAEIANELARQRQLMHTCIRDVDAVDRAIVATNQVDRMSARINGAAVHSMGGRSQPGINVGDLIFGVSKALNRKFGGGDE